MSGLGRADRPASRRGELGALRARRRRQYVSAYRRPETAGSVFQVAGVFAARGGISYRVHSTERDGERATGGRVGGVRRAVSGRNVQSRRATVSRLGAGGSRRSGE